MKLIKILIFLVVLAVLVYFSHYVLVKKALGKISYNKKVIFINNGKGKEGYIYTDDMASINKIVLKAHIFDPPKEIEVGNVQMGQERLNELIPALEAILTAKAKNDLEWEDSMTEYYSMKLIQKIRSKLPKKVLKKLLQEESKYGKFKKILIRLCVKIDRNILCLLDCYDDKGKKDVRYIVLRNIAGEYYQMKMRLKKEKTIKLYVVSAYKTGIWREIKTDVESGSLTDYLVNIYRKAFEK